MVQEDGPLSIILWREQEVSIHFGIISMEVNKKRIFFIGVITGMLVSIGAFLIYTNISAQRKLQLPDSADNIFAISIQETSCEGTFFKSIPDHRGIESIIDVFQQVEIDFSKPEKWRSYEGATGRAIVLFYRDGTERRVEMAALGGDVVIYYPSCAEKALSYRGTWPGSEDFFQNLDYPCSRLVLDEAD